MTDALDFALRFADAGHGLQSMADAALDPSRVLEAAEEGECFEGGERVMVLRRLLAYLHAGTIMPGEWARRFFALARHAHPVLVTDVGHAAWERTCAALDEAATAEIARAEAEHAARSPQDKRPLPWPRRHLPDGKSVLDAQGLTSMPVRMADVYCVGNNPEWVSVLRRLLEDLASGGVRPQPVAQRSCAMAAAVAHALLLHATCAEVGGIFGGQTRATHSIRVKKIFNRRIQSAGGVAHAAFQKGRGAEEASRVAAMGNHNRRQEAGKTRKRRQKGGGRRPDA